MRNIEMIIRESINECAKANGMTVEEYKEELYADYGKHGLRGYCMAYSDETDCIHIQKVDELDVYCCDRDAAKQAERDGIPIIHDLRFPDDCRKFYLNDTLLDTEHNRIQMEIELEEFI